MEQSDDDQERQMNDELLDFLQAAQNGDMQELAWGINLGLANVPNGAGTTALMVAAVSGQTAAVQALLSVEEIDVDAKNFMERTALFLVAQNGDNANRDECARLLIPRANARAADCSGRTPLLWAAAWGSRQLAEMIIAKDPMALKDRCGRTGRTPLGEACASQQGAMWHGPQSLGEAMVKLLAPGSEMNAIDNDGQSPLAIAARFSSAAAMKELLARSDVEARDKQGRTPLMLAMIGPESIEKLAALEHLCDIEAVDNDGRTALMWACKRPVTQSEQNWSGGADDLILRLRKLCNPLARNKNNEDALALAAKEGRGASILALADAGGAGLRDSAGDTPLMSLSARGIESLGASHERAEDLMMACAQALAEHCDISDKNYAGRSAENNAWLQGNEALAIRLEALALAKSEKEQLRKAAESSPGSERRGPRLSL